MPDPGATAAANHGIGLLLSEFHKKIKAWRSVREDCCNMQRDLNIFLAYMDDEIRRDAGTNNLSETRVDEVRELVHDMEDCIERFMHRITCLDGSAGSLISRFAHKIQTWRIRDLFSKEMKQLNKRLRQANVDQIRRLTEVITAPAEVVREPIEPTPVGIAQAMLELDKLLDEVNNEPKKLRVISIMGFGGSGKTTLAHAVFQSLAGPKDKRFPLRAWVDGPDYKDASTLLKSIILQFWPKEVAEKIVAESPHERMLSLNLRKQLGSERYLIVLDDMNMKLWRWIELTFQDQAESSRIIVTTSWLGTAKDCCSPTQRKGYGYVYKMRSLGDTDSRTIARLNEIAHDSCPCHQGQSQCPLETLKRTCDGLPLALISIAKHFNLKNMGCPTTKDCTTLCNSLGLLLHKKPDHLSETTGEQREPFSDLRGVLMNNYTCLADGTLVSRCLLYLGIWPDARLLKKNKITRRWVAEGYTRSKDPECSEQQVADDNFEKLTNMNIIQPIGISTNGTFRALGIVHKFVLHKSIYEKFIMTIDSTDPSKVLPRNMEHRKPRHLFVRGNNTTSSRLTMKVDLSHVRSLTVVTVTENGDNHGSGRESHDLFEFSKYKVIRVLDLEQCTEVNNSHLENICKLWNLRYLSLGPQVNRIPKEVVQLKLLERLHLSKTAVTELPVDIIRMPYLAHLVGKFILPVPEGPELPSTKQVLEESKESKLETLSGIVATERQLFLKLVPNMKLTKVKICFDDPSRETMVGLNEHLLPAIKGYVGRRLDNNVSRSLSIDFKTLYEAGRGSSSQDVMNGLSLDNKCYLTSLKLDDKLLSSMPQFVALLSGLTKLCLSLQSLKQNLLSAASQLPHCLVHLKLVADKIPEDLLIEDGKFLSLESLCIQVRGPSPNCFVPRIEIKGALPELRSFQLICEHVADLWGIQVSKFPKLQEIELHPELSEQERRQWETAARNHRNRPKVLPFVCADHPALAVTAPAAIVNLPTAAGASPEAVPGTTVGAGAVPRDHAVQDIELHHKVGYDELGRHHNSSNALPFKAIADEPTGVTGDQVVPEGDPVDGYVPLESLNAGPSRVGEPTGNGLDFNAVAA